MATGAFRNRNNGSTLAKAGNPHTRGRRRIKRTFPPATSLVKSLHHSLLFFRTRLAISWKDLSLQLLPTTVHLQGFLFQRFSRVCCPNSNQASQGKGVQSFPDSPVMDKEIKIKSPSKLILLRSGSSVTPMALPQASIWKAILGSSDLPDQQFKHKLLREEDY